MKKLLIALLITGPAYGQWPPQLDTTYGGPARLIQPYAPPRLPVPASRSYQVWDSKDGYRWGTVDVQPGGDFSIWDSKDGWTWGSITE
jgi:hypothetical protein